MSDPAAAARVARAAAKLLAVRRGAPALGSLGDDSPADEAEAWGVLRATLLGMGGRIGGYKASTPATAPPNGALLPADGIVSSPAQWPVAPGGKIGIETEVAFRMARGLPARDSAYSRDEVIDAVAGCFPAVEMVATRYADMKAVTPMEAMADNIAHAGLVCGADVPNWRSLDLNNLAVKQTHGGTVQVEKKGAAPPGDPLLTLTRFANHLHAFGLALEAGQVVTTGSWTGLLWVEGGKRVVGSFAELGEVVVDLG
jgi:2-keto-4-pentenoate hydratase